MGLLRRIVRSSPERFDRRAVSWDLTSLPVSADLVIYTEDEWETLRRDGARMVETVEREGLWLHPRPHSAISVP